MASRSSACRNARPWLASGISSPWATASRMASSYSGVASPEARMTSSSSTCRPVTAAALSTC